VGQFKLNRGKENPQMHDPQNVTRIESMYECFSRGDFDGMMELVAPNATFELKGKSPLAGKYTREKFGTEWKAKIEAYGKGSFQMDVHDVLASDRHGLVLGTVTWKLNGKSTQLRTVHVWRIENGVPVAGYEYPRDLYALDELLK
jgi:ketosteroid isomerase-like protein